MEQSRIDALMQIDLSEAMGLGKLPVGDQLEATAEMADIAMKGIWLKIYESLTEEKQDELNRLLDERPNHEKLVSFLKDAIPDVEKLIKAELASYKAVLMPPTIVI